MQSKRAYMKASEEAEQALQAFQKADQDMANSRLQIEKVKGVNHYHSIERVLIYQLSYYCGKNAIYSKSGQ